MYKFKDLGVYRDLQTDQLRLAVISKKGSHQEALFITEGRVMPFVTTLFSMGVHTKYLEIEDEHKWMRYQRNSVMERLLGISFDDDKVFQIEDLQALESALNYALGHSYVRSYEVLEDGTGAFDCMKMGDLIFQTRYKDYHEDPIYTEKNGKYSIISRVYRSIITPTGVQSTKENLPNLLGVSTTRGDSPYGVFPDRSKYLDAAECPYFTLEAYNKFLEKKKEAETDDSNDKN